MNAEYENLFDVLGLFTISEFVKKKLVSYKTDELSGQEQIESILHVRNGKNIPGGKDYIVVIKPIKEVS